MTDDPEAPPPDPRVPGSLVHVGDYALASESVDALIARLHRMMDDAAASHRIEVGDRQVFEPSSPLPDGRVYRSILATTIRAL